MKERSTRSLNFGAYHDLNTVCCSREKKHEWIQSTLCVPMCVLMSELNLCRFTAGWTRWWPITLT